MEIIETRKVSLLLTVAFIVSRLTSRRTTIEIVIVLTTGLYN